MNLLNSIINTAQAASPDVVGVISPPAGIPSDYTKTNSFVGSIIILLMVVAGIFSLWQFLSGGFQYITSSGDKGKISEATQKLTMSVLGLVTMTASFIVISIISKLLFGQFDYILHPILQTVN